MLITVWNYADEISMGSSDSAETAWKIPIFKVNNWTKFLNSKQMAFTQWFPSGMDEKLLFIWHSPSACSLKGYGFWHMYLKVRYAPAKQMRDCTQRCRFFLQKKNNRMKPHPCFWEIRTFTLYFQTISWEP